MTLLSKVIIRSSKLKLSQYHTMEVPLDQSIMNVPLFM